jgi:hypothetical protein
VIKRHVSPSPLEGEPAPSKPDGNKCWDPGGSPTQPNAHIARIINSALVAVASAEADEASMEVDCSRTELDSHANMVVVGKQCLVIEWSGRTASVNPFTPDYDAMTEVPIVDAAVLYECPFSGNEYILLLRNALHVPAMDNNLIPPFVMRETGIIVNDTPKIYLKDLTVEDHTILFDDSNFRIPLSLWGIFSYFPTRAPAHTNKWMSVKTSTP